MSYTPTLDPIFSGNVRVPTATAGDNDTTAASTAFVQGELGDYLPLAGGTLTGALTLSGDPTLGLHAATKSYVDNVAMGLDVKGSVRAATAAALPAYTRTGNVITADANGALAAVDGVTLTVGNRLLLKNGAVGADNGIYVVTDVGDGSNPFVLTRSADADNSPAGEVTSGMFTFVAEGTTHGDTGWVLTTDDPITLNTTALTFTQFSAATVVANLNDLTDVDTAGVVDGSLLRYEATGTQWNDTTALLFSDAGQLRVTTTGASAGIEIGGDTQVYRSAANELTIDATVGAVFTGGADFAGSFGSELGDLYLGGLFTQARSLGVTATDINYQTSLDGDANNRFMWLASGKLSWGDGTAAPDVSLERSGANELTVTATDLVASGNLTANFITSLTGIQVDTFGVQISGGGAVGFDDNGSATNIVIQSQLTADTNARLQVQADGKILLGDGTAAPDTTLYRSAANVLKTDDAFHVTGVLQALGNADVDGTLTVNGKLQADAGINYKTATKTANYTVDLDADHIILVNSTGGAVTITLPASHAEGDVVIVKDSGGAAETNNIVVDPADADTIDGLSAFTLNINYMAATFVSNGTNWFLV